MPRRPVYTDVMEVLERRIASGEFMLRDLPGERTIADEVGVSYMTARKAVLGLIEKEVLSRQANGTLAVHPRLQAKAGRCRVSMLTPSYPSAHLVMCRMLVSSAAEGHDARLRPVEYVHWYDPIVKQAVEGSDGVIIIPSTEPIPPRLLDALTSEGARVVFFDSDLTHHGLPSVRLFAREHIELVFEHLWELGHRRIDLLNTQGRNDEIEARIEQWRSWLALRGGEGRLWDDPAPPFEDAISRAHTAMHRVLQKHRADRPGAVVCTTQPVALGAIRACRDVGIDVGTDMSICTINAEPTGRYFCPSLTGLEMPDIRRVLGRCFDWFGGDQRRWEGGLLLVPEQPSLFCGESTGPAGA